MECRICFDSTDEPLISPCKCTGSMQWVHRTCLQKWINIKKDTKCPVCKENYIINRDETQGFVSYLLGSDTVTTIITGFVCMFIINLSFHYRIRPNTIALSFFMIIFGMHYIQVYFEHEEINFDELFETMIIYSGNGRNQYGHFAVIGASFWIIIDKLKHKILVPYA
tara:strand:- start:1035 stop:1535 length:501 start_codon:yes stop_codon:yes gene_type:complete